MAVHRAEAAAVRGAAARGRSKRIRRNIPLYLMFLPGIAFLLLFKYIPMGGLIIAFKDYNMYDGILGSPWVGMDNFNTLFNQMQTVAIIKNTLMLSVLGLVIGFPVPIALAIMLNEVRKAWFKKSVQTLVYLPHFFSWVIVSGIVLEMFSLESGTINHWIAKLTGEPFPFLYEPGSWVAIFIGSGIWKEMGFSAIIYLAALTTIDPHQYEAASIDGATKWQQIRHVTLPGITPTIVLILILSVGKVMDVGFDPVFMLQNEVVANVSNVISTYIYAFGIQRAQFSLTTAMGLFENLVGLLLVLTANRIARRFNQELW
ncbi:ABC transporter permease [Paenibacillus methanolicus]|uniref:Putative aldouronate transport system permease protein n=1 Tax=Paenibacillus methanolicus TaxID=582686 RepID=A0A5S5CDR4_9BACL|nr:ABC transporter permease subunit [Paenibacillus methanolicus]TYP76490.1 putative aldouronate transport system permease protein [Paenibacillus methanolicus]